VTIPLHVLCVAAARPNFMKVKPVLDALEARAVRTTLVHTGQHYDSAMSDVFFDELGLRQPDQHLGTGSGSHAEQTARVMLAFEPLLDDLAPDWVVVVGDVNSTLACALVTAKSTARLAHVEAGLRSGDWTMPEEVNRVVTDRISDLLLAPSADGVDNLRAEGVPANDIELVGNVMIDSLIANRSRALGRNTAVGLGLEPGHYGLVTLHRPANVDSDEVLAGLLGALGRIATDLPLLFPAHPRTRANIERHGCPPGLTLIEPTGYLDFISLQATATMVLTDSGGVQEETTALGVPCLTLRENTERPITITEGTNILVGLHPDEIVAAVSAVCTDPPPARCPALWDGHAGERVADAILARS
jgi:UDP-N-acetylglucosamine 2-epimerase (non-hydrolysing)